MRGRGNAGILPATRLKDAPRECFFPNYRTTRLSESRAQLAWLCRAIGLKAKSIWELIFFRWLAFIILWFVMILTALRSLHWLCRTCVSWDLWDSCSQKKTIIPNRPLGFLILDGDRQGDVNAKGYHHWGNKRTGRKGQHEDMQLSKQESRVYLRHTKIQENAIQKNKNL